MASSDDFKALLKAGNITEALALALSEAVELKFTTWVPSEEEVDTNEAKPGHRLRTRINMIEGEVEHEIGEEFIGTGRYRDLKQLHLDQVAEGSKLIQNNLKSLQKLIEVLAAIRYPNTKTPVIEPESLKVENQFLPPVEEVADTGLTVEPQDAIVATPVISPEIVTDDDFHNVGLVVEPQELAVADSLISPDTLYESDITQERLPLTEQPTSSLSTPAESLPVLEEETDEDDEDDWDNSVLDLLESMPVVPPPAPETSDSDLRESLAWHDLVEDESASTPQQSEVQDNQVWETLRPEDLEPSPAAEPQNLEETTAPVDADLRDFVEEESAIEGETSQSYENQDFELPLVTESQNVAETTTPVDQDLRDFVEEESAPEQEEPESQDNQAWENLRLLESQLDPTPQQHTPHDVTSPVDEDWGDLVDDEPKSEQAKPIPNLESLDLEEDEEWDDWVIDEPGPILEAPVVDMDSLDLGEEDDWGDLVDDSDPFAVSPQLDKSGSNLDSLEDWDDFSIEELEPPRAPSQKNNHTPEDFDLSEALDDSEWPEEPLPGVSGEFSDSLPDATEDKDANPQSAGKRVPPPPPPNRYPHQNS